MKNDIDDRIKKTFDFLELHAGKLTDSQIDFIRSLRRYHHRVRTLSEKQIATLMDISRYIKVSE